MNHKRSYLSTSALKAFAKSPNHYIEYVNGERKATPAMELGSAIHCAILEPDEWHDRYTIVPKVDRRTKAGKEAWELFQKSSEGKTVLTDEQHRTMDMARIAVHADPLAKNLIDTAVAFEQQGNGDKPHTLQRDSRHRRKRMGRRPQDRSRRQPRRLPTASLQLEVP